MICDLLIKAKYILPMNDALDIIQNGFVAILGNKIIAIGSTDDVKNFEAREKIDAGNSILMPGLINTHTHAAMAMFRGLADDLPLNDWLQNHIWPAEAKYVKPDFVRTSVSLACLEMIKSGTTCFNDMYFFEEVTAEDVEKIGIRAILGEATLDFPTPSCQTPTETIRKTIELAKKFKNNELINIAIAPHSVYALSEENLIKVKEISFEFNLPIHIHVSETKKEIEDCQKQNKLSPVAYLDSLGVLSRPVTAAHSVWLDKNDLEIYKKNNVKVAHCPASNMKLASGVSPVAKMINQGIIVGLGTDGVASNNTLNMFGEMRLAALLHKVSNFNPTLVSAREAVKMATIDGARVLGSENEIGSLEIGKRADMISIDLDQAHLTPMYDPYSHLVYAARGSDVNDAIINGKIIMRNREVSTIEEEKVLKVMSGLV